MSFSSQKACNNTSCMCVALSPGGASVVKQKSAPLLLLDRYWMAGKRPTVSLFSKQARRSTVLMHWPVGLEKTFVLDILKKKLVSWGSIPELWCDHPQWKPEYY